jgi:hypothetical protein
MAPRLLILKHKKMVVVRMERFGGKFFDDEKVKKKDLM